MPTESDDSLINNDCLRDNSAVFFSPSKIMDLFFSELNIIIFLKYIVTFTGIEHAKIFTNFS